MCMLLRRKVWWSIYGYREARAIGKHRLKLMGETIHETIFEIDIDKKKKYTIYLGRKYHFWKSTHTVWIEKIEND